MASFPRAVLVVVAIGAALGVAGQSAAGLHPGMRWVVALGVPWLVAAFFAGVLAGDRARGAIAGATALVVGTLTYYALRVAFGGGGRLGAGGLPLDGLPIVAGWCVASVCGGTAFGWAGALWRRGGSVANVLATAIVSGALVGEALLLTQEWAGRGARLVLTAELAAGALAPFLLTRRRALVVPALALTAAVAIVVAVTEDGVRDALRDVGWHGA
ncbi:MAG: DUF6518 family protein [Solirubrobacteraceae bacterium]